MLVINVKTYEELIQNLDQELRVDENFDIIKRDLLVQNKKLSFYCVDGLVKDEVLEKMLEQGYIDKAAYEEAVADDV